MTPTQKDIKILVKAIKLSSPIQGEDWLVGSVRVSEDEFRQAVAEQYAGALSLAGPMDTVEITVRVTSD